MITNPNKENLKSYNVYRKSLHTQFLKDARNSLVKQKADLEKFQNSSLNHLYKQLTSLRKHNIIPNLETQAGRQTTSQNEIVEVVETFYKNLYSSTNIDQNIASKFLDQNVAKLNPQQSVELEKPITSKELHGAITTMKKGKTPGPDGISLEFYLIFYNNIKHLLLDALNYTYLQTDYVPTLFKGVITLRFKKGNPADMQNYRPISLLNVDYKILNRILNERLQNSLNHLISPLQHAQPGKSTHTASITLRDINHLAQHSSFLPH